MAHAYDLVRAVFDVLREVFKARGLQQERREGEMQEVKAGKSEAERKMQKNLEIAREIFKKAADKVNKVGEREWREVIEQQSYVLEEIVNVSDSHQKLGANHKSTQQAQQNFNNALSDF